MFAKPNKSNSIGSINSDTCDNSQVVNQDDIISLTHHVKGFSEALARLKGILNRDGAPLENPRIAAHEHLGHVLCILKNVLQKYPELNSTDILTAAGTLISKVKGFGYEDSNADPADFYNAIDQVALAFSSSVSEYLMGDIDLTFPGQMGKSRSFENLSSLQMEIQNGESVEKTETGPQSATDLDAILLKLESGVDLALQRAKVWSKYAKDIMAYVEKKALLEAEYSKNLSKMVQSIKPSVTEESFLPFQSAYCTVMDQDMEYANNCQITYNLIQTQKFLEPLNSRRLEHDKMRKTIKEQWTKELKKMQDAVINLRKAKTLYITRQQEYEKAKESAMKAESESMGQSGGTASTKVDKKKKIEEESMHKAAEAETTYKACVVEANARQQDLEKAKASILTQIRELIYQCDQTMKAVTVGYFQLQHTLAAPAPVQYQTLCESCRQYEPGLQYSEFVKRLPMSSNQMSTDTFVFEPYNPEKLLLRKRSTQSSSSTGLDPMYMEDSFGIGKNSDKLPSSQPVKAWGQHHSVGGSDTESASGGSNKSHDSSPSASPHDILRSGRMLLSSSMDELAEDDKDAEIDDRLSASMNISSSESSFKGSVLSRDAQTHKFKKLRAPSKCRECDSYVYFQGAECEKCGLASHKKCLEVLTSPCGHHAVVRRMTTFGVDFMDHLSNTKTEIPYLVAKCVSEIDKRGLLIKGIYRVSGVKSKVEKLCQSFENNAKEVDLSDQHPNVIANVLKLYLRQLPQPLISVPMYAGFIQIAKDDLANSTDEGSALSVKRLFDVVNILPKANFRTLSVIIHHLKRVADNEDENQMSASNLGIVFGPTLLRPSEGTASLHSLMDTPHQSRAIELLILNATEIFGVPPPLMQDTPIETMAKMKAEGTKVVKTETTKTSSSSSSWTRSSGDNIMETVISSQSETSMSHFESVSTESKKSSFFLPGSADPPSLTESSKSKDSDTDDDLGSNDPDFSLDPDSDHEDDDLLDQLLPDSSVPSRSTPPLKPHTPLMRLTDTAQSRNVPKKAPKTVAAASPLLQAPETTSIDKGRSSSLQVESRSKEVKEIKRQSLPAKLSKEGPLTGPVRQSVVVSVPPSNPSRSGSPGSPSKPPGNNNNNSGKQSPSIKQPLLTTTVYTVPTSRSPVMTKAKGNSGITPAGTSTSQSVFYSVHDPPPDSKSTFYAAALVDIPVEPASLGHIPTLTGSNNGSPSSSGRSSPSVKITSTKREPRFV